MSLARRLLRDPKDGLLALRVLLLAGLAVLGVTDPLPVHAKPFWITLVVYGLTNLGYVASRRPEFARSRGLVGIFLFDVLVVSALIVMRGQRMAEFATAYFTLILVAAVVHGAASELLSALVVSLVYAGVTRWGTPVSELLSVPVIAQFVFFFVVSIAMGHLVEAAREAARGQAEVEAQRAELADSVERTRGALVTSRRELDDVRSRLQASDHLATIGLLSAGIVHDLRTPLAAIRSSLDETPALLEELGETASPETRRAILADVRSALADARDACGTLQRLAGSLTGLARASPGVPTSVRPREALEAVERLLRHRLAARLRLETRCETTRCLHADAGRLQQLLLNLACNGLDAMEDEGGTLTILAEDGPDDRVTLTVADTGPGMTEDVRRRAFEPFFTTKAPGRGTGLGLHLVGEIARVHGAEVTVESAVGHGTRVRIDWPTTPEESPARRNHGRDESHPTADRGRRRDDPSRARADATA